MLVPILVLLEVADLALFKGEIHALQAHVPLQ